jgi:hypothetical protein
MVTSYFGSNLTTQDLAITEGTVMEGSPIELTREMDPAMSQTGVFIVQAEGFGQNTLSVIVFDPSGGQIVSKRIDQKTIEGQFEIKTKGSYRLILENSGTTVPAVVGLTHMPEKSILLFNVLGQSIILSGFVGLGISILYMIRSRKKKIS